MITNKELVKQAEKSLAEQFEIIEHDMYFKFKDVFEQIAPDKQEQVIEALKLYNEACLKVENEKYD